MTLAAVQWDGIVPDQSACGGLPMKFAILLGGILALAATEATAEPGYVGSALCSYRLKTKGCDTAYGEGASAMRLDETTARITAKGNRFTKADVIYQYVMRKAAETTIEAGYDLFQIAQQADTTRQISGVDSDINGFVSSYSHLYPGQALLVRFYRGTKPVDAPANVFDAREVLKFIRPASSQ
jgi:hypothetical protein